MDEQEKKEKEIEIQREPKCLKMVKNWDKFVLANREKLQRRIYKGIPDKLRRNIWLKMLKVEAQIEVNKEDLSSNKQSMYNRMLELGYKYSTEIRQIDNDM
jgi:hypothetical protein